MVEGLDLALVRGEEDGLRAGFPDRLQRLGQLDLLDAFIGDEECDLLTLQLVGHPVPFVGFWVPSEVPVRVDVNRGNAVSGGPLSSPR